MSDSKLRDMGRAATTGGRMVILVVAPSFGHVEHWRRENQTEKTLAVYAFCREKVLGRPAEGTRFVDLGGCRPGDLEAREEIELRGIQEWKREP